MGWIRTVSVVVILLCISTVAWAVPYEAQVTARQLAPNTWSYTIRNTSDSQDSVLWWVGFYADRFVVNATDPSGWEAHWSGQNGGYWIGEGPNGEPITTLDVVNWDSGLPATDTLRGFVVEYEVTVSAVEMAGQRWIAAFVGNPYSYYPGYVIVDDNAVPEPSAMAALGFGLVPIAGCALRARLKGRSAI